MKLYDKKFLIYGNCMIRSFGQPGSQVCSKVVLVEVLDKSPPLLDEKRDSDTTLEEAKRITGDRSEIRKTKELNKEKRKNSPKSGLNVLSPKLIRESNQVVPHWGRSVKHFHKPIPTCQHRGLHFYNHCEVQFKEDDIYLIERIKLYNRFQSD